MKKTLIYSQAFVVAARCVTLVSILMLVGRANVLAQSTIALAPETAKKIEAIVESEKAKLGIPGLSIAIAFDNKIQYTKGFGQADIENAVPAKPTTAYRTASIAKPITAAAVMQLVEQGKIELDAPIQKYCAAFPEKNWPVTIRHLLAHQSGIRHYKNREEAASPQHFASINDSLKIFKDEALLFEPGTKFSYTTYGYSLLGCAIEGASGMKYEAYLNQFVFQLAGMTRTQVDNHFTVIQDRARGYIKIDLNSLQMLSEGARKQVKAGDVINAPLHDTSGKIPGGGLLSTAVDLAQFGIAMNTAKFLKSATIQQMWTDTKTKDGKATNYGLGWSIFREANPKILVHTGNQAGARTELRLLPEKGIVIAVMTNLSDANLGEMMQSIQDLLLDAANK
jgi:CubicO group peptidase (beta-lactamase class C family)